MAYFKGFNTRAIHKKRTNVRKIAISQPIVPAVAYAFDTVEDASKTVNNELDGEYYGRYGNPTSKELENKISSLEHAEDALAVSSGMAAISISLMYFLNENDHVVVTKDIYGGTHKLLKTLASKYNIQYDYVDCANVNNIENSIKMNTRAIYIETPSNPSLKLIDIRAVAKVAKSNNLPLIVDNTFMTPYLQNPLTLGADIVVHSATKYLNGHGDVIAGVICSQEDIVKDMRKNIMGDLGQNMNAWESYLILRGIKTLGIRMEKHCDNAHKVAKFLNKHSAVKSVFYPGLPSHPQYDLAHSQMKNMGGIISFEIKGDLQSVKKMINSLKIIMISFSLGDPETLIQHPASMTHSSIPKKELSNFGLSEGLVRLSVGLEDSDDIINDLKQAFKFI